MDTTGMVARYFHHDPETEILVGSGKSLKNGMVVLIDASEHRVDLEYAGTFTAQTKIKALENNRWCKVTNLKRFKDLVDGEVVEFVGEYEDGMKHVRRFHSTYLWFAKISSLEAINDAENKKVVPPRDEKSTDGMVPKHYQPNYDTVTLMGGEELENGMVVLIDDVNKKVDLTFSNSWSERSWEKARKYNRWCKVFGIRQVEDEFYGPVVEFIAEYEDGSRLIRRTHVSFNWFVRNETVENSLNSQVADLIDEALMEQIKASEAGDPHSNLVIMKTQESIDKIMKLFGC